jgi:DNA replication protein DnaC
MRQNKTTKCIDLVQSITAKESSENKLSSHAEIHSKSLDKKSLWNQFLRSFKTIYNKELIINDSVIHNLKPLFYYFLNDSNFFECENLRSDISKPSLDKGLLIIGGYGLGKTDYFKVFQTVFKTLPTLRFKCYNSKELISGYESCITPIDKKEFFNEKNRRLLFIDDISSERVASNYGLIDVVGEILAERYTNNLRTLASCNYSNENQCVEQTLEALGIRYGDRIYDRLFEMFNIIEFNGKSFRI